MPDSSPLRLFAHRGISARFPENTLPAFVAARDEGCTAIELDVQLTRDGRLVVFHDDDLLRLAGQAARVDALTYAELLAFDVGVWKAPAFQGTRVPALAQVFEVFSAGLVNVELKASGGANTSLAAAAAGFLRERPGANAVVSSFDWPLLEAFRKQDAATRLAVLFDQDVWTEALDVARQLRAVALNPSLPVANEAPVRKAREEGFDVNVFTVNDPAVARMLGQRGVNGIFTDDAPRMAAALGQRA